MDKGEQHETLFRKVRYGRKGKEPADGRAMDMPEVLPQVVRSCFLACGTELFRRPLHDLVCGLYLFHGHEGPGRVLAEDLLNGMKEHAGRLRLALEEDV